MPLHLSKVRVLFIALCVWSLAGCGVTKLWGNDDTGMTQSELRPELSLREQAVLLSEPIWDVEKKSSLMSQVAGVLVNGARSAGQALDVFDWTESESADTRQAKKYFSQIRTRENFTSLFDEVMGDLKTRNETATAFRTSALEARDYYLSELELIKAAPDDGSHKDRTKKILNDADEDRRACIQTSKALRQQASVFDAAKEVLAKSDSTLDTEALGSEVGQLLLRAGELRALAEELDLD